MTVPESEQLLVADVAGWREWLARHVDEPAGVWLILAKKGTSSPTTLSYDEALVEAITQGWIDGQVRRRDEITYLQRFTPRRRRSMWSRRNVALVGRLTSEGRMLPAGLAEVARAQADGRWEAAYAGSATMEVPVDLSNALAAVPAAQRHFALLTSQNRYAILHRVVTATSGQTRARRVALYVGMLARGETPHPQRRLDDRRD